LKVVFEKTDMNRFLKLLSRDYRVFGPKRRGSGYVFDEVRGEEELSLDYISTILPPKKFFHSYRETLLTFKLGEEVSLREPEIDGEILLFGVHPCDLNAILRLDKLFSEHEEDPYYLRRRKKSVILALNCTNVGENCFCLSLGTGPFAEEGYDLLLTDLGNRYILESGSDVGFLILMEAGFREAGKEDLAEKERKKRETKAMFKKYMSFAGLAEIFSKNLDHPVWRDLAEKGVGKMYPCLSCGNCSLVCPTCYCFEVRDTLDASLSEGERIRELDSCQLFEYAEMALDTNPRRDRKSRIRHWMSCKFGAAGGGILSSCVGCGRCIEACPSHIDLTEVARIVRGG
jgi:ferredoxin